MTAASGAGAVADGTIPDVIQTEPAVIELRGIEKTFRSPNGPVHAVRGVDLTMQAGEVVALLGPNGAGKSTTVDVLLGLTKADRGAVSVFGRSPADAVRAGTIGAMLQTGALLRDLSVRELVTVFASRGKQGKLPDGLDPRILKYRWWLKAYGLPPREVDELWDDEDFWIPLVEEAFGKIEEMKAAEAQRAQSPGPRR